MVERPKIDPWTYFHDGVGVCLLGVVRNDARFPDGHTILTTPVVEWGEGNTFAVTRSGTHYELGECWPPTNSEPLAEPGESA